MKRDARDSFRVGIHQADDRGADQGQSHTSTEGNLRTIGRKCDQSLIGRNRIISRQSQPRLCRWIVVREDVQVGGIAC